MATILVTGGAGYVGSHVLKPLQAAGHRPVVLDNLSTGHRDLVLCPDLIEGDLADIALLQDLFSSYRIEAVMHYASHCLVEESWRNPLKYYRDNVRNALNLLQVMKDFGVRAFIFSSTCAVYGVPELLPIQESHALGPVNPYGASKMFIERMLRDFDSAYGIRYISLRYFNAAGADPEGQTGEDHEPETHLIPRLLDVALGRLPELEIYGDDYSTPDGTCVRDYIHVLDLATAHLLALERLLAGSGSEVYNLGTGCGYSVRQVIAAVEEVTGVRIKTRIGRRRPGDPPILVADPTKAMRELNWEPRRSSLREMVATAWAWHRKRKAQL